MQNAFRYLDAQELAATDSRTGLGSASAFEEALPREISAARRHGRPLCLIQIDLDNFGAINKRTRLARGRQRGAGGVRRAGAPTIRGSDTAFRNSGGADEFFLILPETTREEAKLLYGRLEFEMATPPLAEVDPPVTMSSGLAELRAGRHARRRSSAGPGAAAEDREGARQEPARRRRRSRACRRSRLRPRTMSTAALALLAAVAALVVAAVVATMVLRSRRASERRLDEGLLAIGRADGRARPRARARRSSGCARTRCARASSSRSGRRSTSTRSSPAAPRRQLSSTASPARPSRSRSTACRSRPPPGSTAPTATQAPSAARRTAAGSAPSGSRTTTPRTAPGEPAIRSAIAVPLETDERRSSAS